MAYNYYQPTYQPYYQQNQQTSIIWVGGLSEAQMYPVAPNAAVALWDSTCPALYLKQADASGRPSMKVFDLVERTEPPVQAHPVPSTTTQYATKDELTAALEALKGTIESLTKKGVKDE